MISAFVATLLAVFALVFLAALAAYWTGRALGLFGRGDERQQQRRGR